jgi:hypothetical protein
MPKSLKNTNVAARRIAKTAQQNGVGIDFVVLIPIIATVLQTLITSCVKNDQERADRLKAAVTKAYMPKQDRYKSPIVARVREVVRDSARGSHMSSVELDLTTRATLDEIRLADDETVASVLGEVQS